MASARRGASLASGARPRCELSDLGALVPALEAAAPEARPIGPLRRLGEGFFSVALETASGCVFRLGTDAGVFPRYAKECRLLPRLRELGLPVAVPEPRWLLSPSEAFPCGGMGYRRLEGVPLAGERFAHCDRARIARDIARFDLALHQIPIDAVRDLELPGPEVERAWLVHDRDVSRVALRAALSPAELDAVTRWWDEFLADPVLTDAPVALRHGDVGDENLLVSDDGARLLAVLDFEHAALGDPALDFMQLRYLDAEFQREVLESYRNLGGRPDEGIDDRLERYWQHGPFPGIRHAWLRGDPWPRDRVLAALCRHGVLP